MKTFAVPLTLILCMACAATGRGQGPKPPKQALDPKNPKSVAEHLTYNTRRQQSYETRFKARIAPPRGKSLTYDGTCVSVKPGLLYIHYAATSGEQNIIRVGPRVWIHRTFAGWQTAREVGMNGAARGIQNPDEVLSILADHLEGARLDGPGIVSLKFVGDDIEKVMKGQARKGAYDWKNSEASIKLHADADNRLRKFVCDATLKSRNPVVKGTVTYHAEVEVVSYNKATGYTFRDEDKNEIELSDKIRKAIESLRKEQK